MTLSLKHINELIQQENNDYIQLLCFLEKNDIKYQMKISLLKSNKESILIKLEDFHIQSIIEGYYMLDPIIYTTN